MNGKIQKFIGKEIELEYMLTGEEHKETIMFVHGAGANLRQFTHQHQHLSQSYRVLSVSLRGHGQSSHPEVSSAQNFTLEKNRDDLIELIEALQLQNINYVGNSAGGVIGLLLVEKRRDLFKSLTTFGTTAEMKLSPWLTRLVAGIDKCMIKINAKAYLQFSAKHTSKYPASIKAIFELFIQAKEAIPYLRANLGHYNCINIIENMKIPYLLIQGEEDGEINRLLKSTLEAITSNPRASVKTLHQAGHIANLDQPEAFNQIITSYIEGLSASI